MEATTKTIDIEMSPALNWKIIIQTIMERENKKNKMRSWVVPNISFIKLDCLRKKCTNLNKSFRLYFPLENFLREARTLSLIYNNIR